MLKKGTMIMRFRQISGKQVGFHRAMNYLFRPTAFENFSLYQFFSMVDFSTKRKTKLAHIENWEFTEQHPCFVTDVVVYRDTKCVPTFQWNWLGSTKGFKTTLEFPVESTDPEFRKREEYAYRFMLLFLPHRIHDDLLSETTYQKKFATAVKEGLFSDEMIEIAQNIQAIQNSIESGIPPNALSEETELVTTSDFADDVAAEDTTNHENLLANLSEIFSSNTGENTLISDTTTIDRNFGKKDFATQRFNQTPVERQEMQSVINMHGQDSTLLSHDTNSTASLGRFTTCTTSLNTLAMHRFLKVRENPIEFDDIIPESENARPTANGFIDATGTWESIHAWGLHANLDPEQMTAFEILASTYVLTFYDEATGEVNETSKKSHDGLFELARRKLGSNEPLRMFITGPAGAGKCKLTRCQSSENHV